MSLRNEPRDATDGPRTDWFATSVKPVHEGVYEVRNGPGFIHFARWFDRAWRISCSTVKAAAEQETASSSFVGVDPNY
jgi:hypothetical protein